MRLTPKQEAVSKIFDHSAYVVSIPGSGKTGTSVQLAKNILCHPSNSTLLVVTFTRSGAGEVKERLQKTLTSNAMNRLRVATLDSCIVNMARNYFKSTNQRFDLVLGPKYMFIVKRIMNELDIKEPSEVTEVLDYYLGALPCPPFECEEHKFIMELYEKILSKRHYPSYDLKSLCRLTIEKMKQGAISPFRFSHIIVDEFQDTSALQYQWLKVQARLAGSKIIGVGDDHQSIYAFSGAKGYENFVSLAQDFDARPYSLDMCFRCAPNILKFAESIIKHNTKAVKKTFGSPADLPDGKIKIHRHINLLEELIPLLRDKYSNTAVLTRNNRLLSLIEINLADEGIPYQRISGKNSLFGEHNVIAFMRILALLHGIKDLKDLPDVLGWLGESESNLYKLAHYLKATPSCRCFSDIDWDLLGGSYSWSGITQTLISKQAEFGAPTVGRQIFERLKLIAKVVSKELNNKLIERKIFGIVDIIYRKFHSVTLKERIEKIFQIIDSIDGNEIELDRTRLSLSTAHSSKGLEWDRVWIVGADRGDIPAKMQESPISKLNDALSHNEEERRLLYVAVTRAKEELNITYKNELSPLIDVADLSLVEFIEKKELAEA